MSFSLGILGCGAVAQDMYVPALLGMRDAFSVKFCVDLNADNAMAVAERFGADAIKGSIEVIKDLPPTDGVIVALPNHLHATAVVECLGSGRHTLCEKPVAIAPAECDRIQETLADSGKVLSVNLFRRVYPATAAVKWLLQTGCLGDISEIEVWEGGLGAWNSRTGFQFDQTLAGGGVTLDRGSHVFDLLIHWFGTPELRCYRHDAAGGCEANSYTELRWAPELAARVSLSKTEPWTSHLEIRGSQATLNFDSRRPAEVQMRPRDKHVGNAAAAMTLIAGEPNSISLNAPQSLLAAWAAAALGIGDNPTPFAEVRQSIALISACYEQAAVLDMPWTIWKGD